MRISGEGGRVRIDYRTVATLGPWTMTQTHARTRYYELTARASNVDTFWQDRGPHTVTLTMGSRTWTWPGVTVRWHGHPHLSITGVLDGAPLIH